MADMNCKPPAPEAEDAIMHHGYPSPTIDETDTQYYQAESRKAPHAMHQLEAQQDGSAAAGASDVQQGDRYALSTLQQGAQASLASQHHQSSAAELQLTAQLTQDIAQGLGPIADGHARPRLEEAGEDDGRYGVGQSRYEHVQTAKYAPGHEIGNGGGMRPQSGSPMDHDHALDQAQSASLEDHIQAELQSRHIELQDGGQSQQPRSHTHTYDASASSLPGSSEFSFSLHSNSLSQSQSEVLYASTDSSLGRKRTKVSRACDECRRKKIRCEAPSEAGDQPCSHCIRVSATCLFSRVPQKRGPSKGYIKELADRIISIEGKLSSPGGDVNESVTRKTLVEPFSPTPVEETTRKRPFSHMCVDDLTTPPAVKPWAVESRVGQQFCAGGSQAYHSNNDLAARPAAVAEPPEMVSPAHHITSMGELDVHGLPATEEVRELGDGTFGLYLAHIHPTFPIMAKTKARVQSLLLQCPITLREAFHEAFHAMLKPLLPLLCPSDHAATGDVSVAHDLLKYWDRGSQPNPELGDLIHLQTLVMMIIEADAHGVTTMAGRPNKSALLWQAVGLARSMKLYEAQPDSIPGPESDMNSDDNVAIRTWWAIIMLDRWHAIGTAGRLMVDNDLVIILPGLRFVLGEVGYHLIQLANFLGHLVLWSWQATSEITPTGSGLVVGAAANLIIESFRINFPSHLTVVNQPVLHLAYWHVRLLYALFSPSAQSQDLLWASEKMVSILSTNPQLVSPLNHHFLSLASVVLLELCSVSRTKKEAARQVHRIMHSELAPSAWNDMVRRHLGEQQSRVAAPSATQNLQQLADLVDLATTTASASAEADIASTHGASLEPAAAAAAPANSRRELDPKAIVRFDEVDHYRGHGFDPLPVLRQGYLNAFKPLSPGGDGIEQT